MKKNKKRWAMAVMALFALALTAGCGKTQIGYVDGSKVQAAPQVKAILDQEQKTMQDAQTKTEADLKQKQASGVSAEDLQKAQQEAMTKLQAQDQGFRMQVQQKVQDAVSAVAKAKRLDVVLDNEKQMQTVPYGGVDVTDDVVSKLQ